MAVVSCLVLILSSPSPAQPPQVVVTDSGTLGPGAPRHVVGLKHHQHTIVMDTGARTYALRYRIGLDTNNPPALIPGGGYIGMPRPVDQNWYANGFFDMRINGQSLGTTLIHSLTGRSSGDRGIADFVFDTERAVVRLRFVALAGGDCVYAQALLEPKAEIGSVMLDTYCYPSAYVGDSDRHVRTATRDFAQGEKAELNLTNEWWMLCYDSIYDAGYFGQAAFGAVRKGRGPCAMLWLPGQTEWAKFTIHNSRVISTFAFIPTSRDFRFIFFDYADTKNEAAKSDLQARGQTLLEELSTFSFSNPGFADWPLQQKQAEIQEVLASAPENKKAAAQYEQWGRELAAQLKLAGSGAAGAILAEANAAGTISQWEHGLRVLKLAEAAFAEVQKLLVDLDAQGRSEKEPGMAEELTRRLDEYREKLAGLKSQSEGKLEDDAWKPIDIEVQALVGQIDKTIAEAGLAALLKEF
jgi:hypothetical protein